VKKVSRNFKFFYDSNLYWNFKVYNKNKIKKLTRSNGANGDSRRIF